MYIVLKILFTNEVQKYDFFGKMLLVLKNVLPLHFQILNRKRYGSSS